MAHRDKPPFRADHVGSLLRPESLLKARSDHAAGTIDDDALSAAEDEAIREVVAMQEDVGLQSATDGEFRRQSWHMDFIYELGGSSRWRVRPCTCSSRATTARPSSPRRP